MAQISALTTEKAPQNTPNVKGCPKSQSSIDLGHFLTLWLAPNWEVLGMRKMVMLVVPFLNSSISILVLRCLDLVLRCLEQKCK